MTELIKKELGKIRNRYKILLSRLAEAVERIEVLESMTTVDINSLVFISDSSYNVDNSSTLVFDASGADTSTKIISVTNGGDDYLFLRMKSAVVGDGSTAAYIARLAKGEHIWLNVGYKTGTDNDVYAIRGSSQTNDNVIVSEWGYA